MGLREFISKSRPVFRAAFFGLSDRNEGWGVEKPLDIVPFALTGHGIGNGVSIITPGALTSSSADANALIRIRFPAKKRSERRRMRRSFRTRVSFSGRIPRVCTLGWYAMPR